MLVAYCAVLGCSRHLGISRCLLKRLLSNWGCMVQATNHQHQQIHYQPIRERQTKKKYNKTTHLYSNMGNAKSTMFYLWKDKHICHCMSLLWFVSFHGLQLKFPVTKHCFTIPKRTAATTWGSAAKVLSSHLCCIRTSGRTEFGSCEDVLPTTKKRHGMGSIANLNLMMLEHQDIIVF